MGVAETLRGRTAAKDARKGARHLLQVTFVIFNKLWEKVGRHRLLGTFNISGELCLDT